MMISNNVVHLIIYIHTHIYISPREIGRRSFLRFRFFVFVSSFQDDLFLIFITAGNSQRSTVRGGLQKN